MFTNWLNMDFSLRDWFKKTVHGVERHGLYGKMQRSVNVRLKVVRDIKESITIDFQEKLIINSAFCQNIKQNSSNLLGFGVLSLFN